MTKNYLNHPHIRPFQPIPVQKDGKQMIALKDPFGLCEQTIIIPPQGVQLANLFNGERTLEELKKISGIEIDKINGLIKQLDSFGLLWGPTAEKLEKNLIEKLNKNRSIPARISRQLGDDPTIAREKIQQWFDQTEDPKVEEKVKGIICPWLEYEKMWEIQASAFYPWREAEPPNRVVIFGTNPLGIGDGASVCPFGFKTPIDTSPPDDAITNYLKKNTGNALFADQLDFVSDPSIEALIPWVQTCFQDVPVVGVLIPDPKKPLLSNDGARIDGTTCIKHLKDAIKNAGGETIFVCSANMSHAGPQFGEPRPIDEQREKEINKQDRELISKYLTGELSTFLGALDWTRNSTRWSGIGPMAAMLEIVESSQIELIDYGQTCQPNKNAMISGASIAFLSNSEA